METEDRLARLEMLEFAHALVLRALITEVWADKADRDATCEKLTQAVLNLYGGPEVTERGHRDLPAVVRELEAMFAVVPRQPSQDV